MSDFLELLVEYLFFKPMIWVACRLGRFGYHHGEAIHFTNAKYGAKLFITTSNLKICDWTGIDKNRRNLHDLCRHVCNDCGKTLIRPDFEKHQQK
jgi:hypothetical protein